MSVDGKRPLSARGAPVSLCWAILGRTIGQRGQDAAPQSHSSPPSPKLRHVKWVHCDCRPALIFMYTFFFSPSHST